MDEEAAVEPWRSSDVGSCGVEVTGVGSVIPLRPDEAGAPDAGPTDAELVRAYVAGDAQSGDALVRRHGRMVLGLAHRLLAGADDVDDLVQDVFLTAFSRLQQLRDGQAFASWVSTITVQLTRKRLRRRQLQRRLGLVTGQAPPVDALVSPQAAPDERAELRVLYGMLEQLRPDARVALVLRRVEGMTVQEVAEHMGSSPATVKRRIQEAEVLLSARLRRGRGG